MLDFLEFLEPFDPFEYFECTDSASELVEELSSECYSSLITMSSSSSRFSLFPCSGVPNSPPPCLWLGSKLESDF